MRIKKVFQRPKLSHKGDNGRILVIGGSKGYVGAVALAGLAAMRVGADIVTVCAPEKVAWAINCLAPDLITKKFKGGCFKASHSKEIIKLSKNFDVILIGNGIGRKSSSFVNSIVRIPKPKVIDADAIKSIQLQRIKNAVLTPHKKEYHLLLKNSKIAEKSLQKNLGNNVILLKGPVDRIITKNKIILNKTGNPGMTKAGTGDVLAGLVAGFISRRCSLEKAAYLAAYYNGMIGDNLKKKKGYTYLASDIVNDIRKISMQMKQKSI